MKEDPPTRSIPPLSFFLHRKNSHQAEGDYDSDGDCANVTLATINLGSDIPENECHDSDTSADDDERVVLEVHELLTLESEKLLL